MQTLPLGKLRGLQLCSSPHGVFTILALDHRQNLRRALNPGQPEAVADADLTRFKLEVAAALANEATAVLLDPEFSAAQALAAGMLPRHAGLVVAVEATGYTGDPTARQSRILPGWGVEKARRMGASMVKLLVYYHPDSRQAAEIEDFVSQVADECRRYEIALMLEPLSYSLDPHGERLSSSEKRYVVVETARRLTPMSVDLLKAEFPQGDRRIDLGRGLRRNFRGLGYTLDPVIGGGGFRDLSAPGNGRLSRRSVRSRRRAGGLERGRFDGGSSPRWLFENPVPPAPGAFGGSI
jgi:tagatose 1,6-diphosphate aldolase